MDELRLAFRRLRSHPAATAASILSLACAIGAAAATWALLSAAPRRRELIQLLMGETARLVGIGLAAGLAVVWGGAGAIRSFLYRIEPLDPLTLATVAILLLLLACIVSLRPALRAARVDLAAVLKAE